MEKNIFEWENKETWNRSIKSVEEFKKFYTHLRIHHGCKLKNISTFSEEGILMPSESSFKKLIKELPSYPVDHEMLDEHLVIENYIYFSVDKRHLIEDCGHYMLYGSEAVLALAIQLDESNFGGNKRYLEKNGTPTIITCDIPLKKCEETFLNGTIRNILESNCNQVSENCIRINENVHVDEIVEYTYPKRIRNPYTWTWVRIK